MTEHRRWDTDDRYVGVADAGRTTPDVERLLAMTSVSGWITEDAAAHLGPHAVAAAAEQGLEVVRLEVVDDVLELDVRGAEDSRTQHIAAFAILGAFAESSTHVRERRDMPEGLELEIVTGVLPGDGVFATHGHLARIRVMGRA